jgi:hypothetical protein
MDERLAKPCRGALETPEPRPSAAAERSFMSLLKLKAQSAGTSPVSPREFFTSICPKVLELHAGICARLGGRYAFQLFGEGGGAWTLDFPRGRVDDGVQDRSWDLYLEMEAGDFTDLLKGTLDVEAAAGAGRLRVDGDVRLFSNLIAILEPAAA